MKRLRPDRPSGRPKFKERKVCLKCGRTLCKMERRWKRPYQTTWRCNKCWMFYGYLEGILKGMAGKSNDWWETKGGWKDIPEGMLVVYGGEEA